MGVLDFLFQGSPPASVTTYGETTSNVPTWYSDYTQGLISKANSIAAEPYQPYGQPRIAGFDPAQTAAYNQTMGLQGQYQPFLDKSSNAIYNAGEGSSLQAAQPYINQALQYNPLTAASGSIGQAGALINQGYGDTSSLAQPYFNQSQAYTQQAAQGTAGLADPYMQQASQLSTQGAQTGLGGIQDYMNPYTDQVVNRIGELGARNLRENLLPNIQDRAIQAGTFGGSRSGEAIGRALRDTQESTLAQQSAALQQGYTQAGSQLQADKARQLQAAQQQAGFGQQTAGLSGADQQRLLAAGQQQAALGQATAGLEGADLARYGQAGSQMGALGQMQGNLAGAAGTQNLQAAQQMGTLSNQDFARLLQSGQAMGALGQQTQQLGMQNIGALEAAGAGQQQQEQRSLDQSYQDFLNQRDYDRNNIAFLNASVRGLTVPTSTTTESTGPASVYQPSPLSQFGSALATGYGLNRMFGQTPARP
jgi:hypothetical protein